MQSGVVSEGSDRIRCLSMITYKTSWLWKPDFESGFKGPRVIKKLDGAQW